MRTLSLLDFVALALALPVFVIAGLPLLGFAAAAAIWLMWRGVGEWTDRKASAIDDPRRVAGIATGSMIGRGWVMGLTLIVVGLSTSDDVGLSAAVTCVILFTVYFTALMLGRTLGGDSVPAPRTPSVSS